MVWDPARITPRPWPDVLGFYRQIEDRNHDFAPLRLLVEHIASLSGPPLFGATSGTALLVAREEGADWTHDAVRMDVGLDGSIRFVLPEKRQAVKPVTFERDGGRVVAAFTSFLRDAGWGEVTLGP